MGIEREVLHKKLITVAPMEKPSRQHPEDGLPYQYFVSISEKILVDSGPEVWGDFHFGFDGIHRLFPNQDNRLY